MKPVELFIHFDDADPAGITFFGNYFRLAHRALELSLPQWGLTWEDFFKRPGFGFPVRHSEAEYFEPLRPGRSIYVLVTPEKMGESSMTFKYEFRKEVDTTSKLSATLTITHVCVDTSTLRKAPLPKDLASKLSIC